MPEDEIWKISKYCAKMIFICSLIILFSIKIRFPKGMNFYFWKGAVPHLLDNPIDSPEEAKVVNLLLDLGLEFPGEVVRVAPPALLVEVEHDVGAVRGPGARVVLQLQMFKKTVEWLKKIVRWGFVLVTYCLITVNLIIFVSYPNYNSILA